jgi:hypothetical protein
MIKSTVTQICVSWRCSRHMFETRSPDKAVFDTSKFKYSVLLYISLTVSTKSFSLHMSLNRPLHDVSSLQFYFYSIHRITVLITWFYGDECTYQRHYLPITESEVLKWQLRFNWTRITILSFKYLPATTFLLTKLRGEEHTVYLLRNGVESSLCLRALPIPFVNLEAATYILTSRNVNLRQNHNLITTNKCSDLLTICIHKWHAIYSWGGLSAENNESLVFRPSVAKSTACSTQNCNHTRC